MFGQILNAIWQLTKMAFVVLAVIPLFQAMYVFIKNQDKRKHNIKFKLKHKLFHLRDYRYVPYAEFLKWVVIDVLRGKERLKLYGIWCFTGYYGMGKTFGAVTYALKLKKEYPDIQIYSNFNVRGQDGRIKTPQDIIDLELKPGRKIIIFDEIQSTFSSNNYADFPIELLWGLTQCRKNSMAVFASSPVYTRMSIQLRESTDKIVECKNIWKLDRWFRYEFYHASDYERYMEADREKKRKYRESVTNIIAHDRDYKNYNTHQMCVSSCFSHWVLCTLKNHLCQRSDCR